MNETKTNLTLLRERVERNYEDFKELYSSFDIDTIVILAAEVAAVNEVYRNINSDRYVSEDAAEYLLTFENPLDTLATEWERYSWSHGTYEFEEFIDEFVKKGGVNNDNPYEVISNELYSKYGYDVTLDTACLLELLEVGRKLLGIFDSRNYTNDEDFEIFEVDCTDEDDSGDSKDSEGGDV